MRKKMFETPEERVVLLRKGISQKQIETLYIEANNLKVVNPPAFIELVEINTRQNTKMQVKCEAAVEYAQSLCSEMANLCDISKLSETIYNKYTNTKA